MFFPSGVKTLSGVENVPVRDDLFRAAFDPVFVPANFGPEMFENIIGSKGFGDCHDFRCPTGPPAGVMLPDAGK